MINNLKSDDYEKFINGFKNISDIKGFKGYHDYVNTKYKLYEEKYGDLNTNFVGDGYFSAPIVDNLKSYSLTSNDIKDTVLYKEMPAAPTDTKAEDALDDKDTAPKGHVDIFALDNGGTYSRLFSMMGVVYEFDRGLIMIDEDGTKHVEVLDGTPNHHADRVPFLANNIFGRSIQDRGPSEEFNEAVEAATTGLTTFLLEGNSCFLFIPDNLTIEQLDQIMSEIEPRSDFNFMVVRTDGVFTPELPAEMVIDYLTGIREELERNNAKDGEKTPDDKLSINEYINSVLKYIDEQDISLIEYYRLIGRLYRTRDNGNIPDFELKNPFLDESDIKLLVEKDDNRIVEYFARAMFRVINANVANDHKNRVTIAGEYTGHPSLDKKPLLKDDGKELDGNKEKKPDTPDKPSKPKEEDKKPHNSHPTEEKPANKPAGKTPRNNPELSPRGREILREIEAMLKEEPTEEEKDEVQDISFDSLDDMDGYAVIRDEKDINIYTYNHNEKTKLKNRVTYNADEYNIKTGYYVNLRDYLNSLKNSDDEEISFVTENNIELDYEAIYQSLEEYCLEQGAIKIMADNKLTDEIYVNRKDIRTFLKNFKLKHTKQNIDSNAKGLK